MAPETPSHADPHVRVRVEYRDAALNWHCTFAVERDDGRRVRGEAVHDPRLGRTLLAEDLPGLLPGDIRLVKRAVAAACKDQPDNDEMPPARG